MSRKATPTTNVVVKTSIKTLSTVKENGKRKFCFLKIFEIKNLIVSFIGNLFIPGYTLFACVRLDCTIATASLLGLHHLFAA